MNKELIPLVDEYLLSEEELGLVLDDLSYVLEREKLLQMFASDDRESFARDLLTSVIENVVKWRISVSLPSNEMFIKSIGHVWEMSEHDGELYSYFSRSKIDTKQMGKRLLDREVSGHAADKAWYHARQMNTISTMQENSLITMAGNEKAFADRIKKDADELKVYKSEVDILLRR